MRWNPCATRRARRAPARGAGPRLRGPHTATSAMTRCVRGSGRYSGHFPGRKELYAATMATKAISTRAPRQSDPYAAPEMTRPTHPAHPRAGRRRLAALGAVSSGRRARLAGDGAPVRSHCPVRGHLLDRRAGAVPTGAGLRRGRRRRRRPPRPRTSLPTPPPARSSRRRTRTGATARRARSRPCWRSRCPPGGRERHLHRRVADTKVEGTRVGMVNQTYQLSNSGTACACGPAMTPRTPSRRPARTATSPRPSA